MRFVLSRKTGDFTTNSQIFRLSAAALIVGSACAFIAILLLKTIYFITNVFFYHRISLTYVTPTNNHLHEWVMLPPIVGAIIIGFIARYGSEKIRGHGIPEAIEAMLTNESKVHPKVAFWKPISAAISIGSGEPFGAEGPIIMTGGSFGSLFSQFFHFSSIERRILLVAGAAGGMAATFAAPVSSVLFAVELLIFEFKPRSLVPIAIASAAADSIRIALIGSGPLFGMPSLPHVTWLLVLVAGVIGVIGSILAVLLTYAIYRVEDAFRKLPIHWMWWPAIGAIIIAAGGLICPRTLGVGYDSISAMLNAKLTVVTLLTLFIIKTIVWVVALGSGTSGGILAPILIIGGSLGGIFGELIHAEHPGMWALLGMSAIFAGVTRTPFTSIVFPLELTHNLGAMLPLLITSSIATGISAYILPRSILTEKIARRGLHLTHEYSTDPLAMHYAKEIVYFPSILIEGQTSIKEALEILMQKGISDNWVGITNSKGTWVGLVNTWDIVRSAKTSADKNVIECVSDAPCIHTGDTAKTALAAMVKKHVDWTKVVSEDGTCIGALTVSQLLQLRCKERIDEEHRHRVYDMRLRFQKRISLKSNHEKNIHQT